jgi:hypothetical protein
MSILNISKSSPLQVTLSDSHEENSTLPEKSHGADRDRTDDLRLAKPALSQLSYSP